MEEKKLAVGEGYSLVDMRMALLRALQPRRCSGPTGQSSGLRRASPRIVSYLVAHEHATQREMAEFFGMDPASVSRMVDALVRAGLVTVEENPADRRTKRMALTEAGRAVVAPWDARCAEVDEAMLVGFTAEERARFMDYLERARHNLAVFRGSEASDRA